MESSYTISICCFYLLHQYYFYLTFVWRTYEYGLNDQKTTYLPQVLNIYHSSQNVISKHFDWKAI